MKRLPMPISFAQFRVTLYAPLVSTALLVTGCATLPPPTAELSAAQQAVMRAEAVDADQYAPEALQQAQTALQQAQAAFTRGKNDDARGAAVEASASGDMARVRSEAARVRAEYQQRFDEVATLQARLHQEVAQTGGVPLDIAVAGASDEQKLQALDADPRLNPFAQFERLQARQAVAALATVKRRDLNAALTLAQRRVEVAGLAARVEATRREIERLERERSELLVEASRRDADKARAETEKLRLQAQLDAEEAARQQAQAEQAQQQEEVRAARAREEALARKEAELVSGAKLPPMQATDQGNVFTFSGAAFASGKAQLTKAAAASVKALGLYVNALPGRTAQVVGHTDSQGDAAANQNLSEQRAQQVRAGLVAAGLKRDRVTARGAGSAEPVADNTTAAGRAKNRRVEVVVQNNL
ncbi:MAG: OmpA family protein [Thermomonas sp.]|uniref:OmpA family protein n=1 Tax=Thermomonas sp. TaxID=1971895 RepID=UPI001EC6C661|nr:OmpA family protein [Thermomonas sp.]MBV2208669.1 OmpA family protein [Thermomonas sp.]